MSEALPQPDAQTSVEPAASGRLRQAREEAGLHIAVLATMLKVPVKKLEALEQGRFHELPDLTFARALACSACRHLKMDPTPVLAELPGARAAPLIPTAVGSKPLLRAADGAIGSWTVWAYLKAPSAWTAAALLLSAAAVYWWPATGALLPVWVPEPAARGGVVSPSPLPASELVASAASSSVMPPPAAPDVTPPAVAQVVTDGAVLGDSTVGGSARQASGAAVAFADPVVESSSAEALLMIVGTGETWLEVVDAKGAVLLRRLLRSGEAHRFSAQPPYRVVLGNAAAARVVVRGKDFDTTPFVRNSVAKFEVQ